MIGWLSAVLAAVGIFAIVLGSVADQTPLLVAGAVLVGYVAGITQMRLIVWDAFKDLRR